MRNLDIRYIKAQNFLCFGEEPMEIDFKKKSNVVLVEGLNLDVQSGDSRASSNGAGKSSIPEIIVYTLFGKTIKHPKKISHKDVINNSLGKGLRTEVIWGDHRVVRTRKPDSLRLWESKQGVWDDSTEITLGGQPATQRLIEDKIGLNYETFVNVVVFTDNNAGSFLECDASGKREIVENLLSLEKYKEFAESAKALKKENKDAAKAVESELASLKKQISQAESRIKATIDQEASWRLKAQGEAAQIKEKINAVRKEMNRAESDEPSRAYNDAVAKISEINSKLPAMEEKRQKLESALEKAQDRLSSLKKSNAETQLEIKKIEAEESRLISTAEEHESEVSRLEKSEGGKCKYCFGTISKGNFANYAETMYKKASDLKSQAAAKASGKPPLEIKSNDLGEKIKSVSEAITTAKESITSTSSSIRAMRDELVRLGKVDKPASKDAKSDQAEGQIKALTEQLAEKMTELEGDSPFKPMLESLSGELSERQGEVDSKELELNKIESELPYYDFWAIGFGDSGIRKFVIDGVIPALNSRIAYWLQFLIDGRISLQFDNELEEKIERSPPDGDPFVYHAMSGGERRRLNLAVSQAFAHVMMLNSGTCPSLVFLDEVTTNIDQIGVVGVYNMIMELAKSRQVFITTHDGNLREMLDGCEVITIEKKRGRATLKN